MHCCDCTAHAFCGFQFQQKNEKFAFSLRMACCPSVLPPPHTHAHKFGYLVICSDGPVWNLLVPLHVQGHFLSAILWVNPTELLITSFITLHSSNYCVIWLLIIYLSSQFNILNKCLWCTSQLVQHHRRRSKVKTYGHDHSLESSQGALSDATIGFMVEIFSENLSNDKIIKIHWNNHSLESSQGTLSDGTIGFMIEIFSGKEKHHQ
jgi:hypothetical protein